MAAMLCVATVSAQTLQKAVDTAKSSDWSVGLRVNGGVQAVAECFYAGDKYVEGRLGLAIDKDYFGADFTFLHNWNLYNWNWTPKVGKWYLDAGCGANIGGGKKRFYVGVAGDVKFGIKFNKVPIRLAVDYTPVIACEFVNPDIYMPGLWNVALSATYCF